MKNLKYLFNLVSIDTTISSKIELSLDSKKVHLFCLESKVQNGLMDNRF